MPLSRHTGLREMQRCGVAACQEAAERDQRAGIARGLGRLRVDGKYFLCGGRRFRVQGVTYGPFSAENTSEPFPARDRAQEDFSLMQAIGINSIRTYHLPPEWLLRLADE